MHTQPQASWSLRKRNGNPCDTTLLPHHQPIRELYTLQFSRSVVSNSLRPHESQHARPPCHQHPEFTQTHVHRVGGAIQPSHPLQEEKSSTSPLAPNPSQHQSLSLSMKLIHVCSSDLLSNIKIISELQRNGKSVIKILLCEGSMAPKAESMWHYLTEPRKIHRRSLE